MFLTRLIKDIVDFWVETWNTNQLLFWVEASSTLMGMTACTMLNVSVKSPDMLTVLILYVVSALGLAWASFVRRASFVMFLMMFYAITSIWGLFRLIS